MVPSNNFEFNPDWWEDVFGNPLDRAMVQTLEVGLQTARMEVHVVTGYLRDSIGGGYRQADQTILLWADAPYALVEEMRGPAAGYTDHRYLTPAFVAMAAVWGGEVELHLPHAGGTPLQHQAFAEGLARRARRRTSVIQSRRGRS